MLRMIFASGLIAFGALQSLRGPVYALLFYLGFAYFRPELWVWGDQLQALNLSLLIGIYAVTSTFIFGQRIAFTSAVWLMLIFLTHGFVSAALSDHWDWCFRWWKLFAKITVITILIISHVNTEQRLRWLFLVIAFALGFDGVKQGWAYLVLGLGEPNTNPVEILGDNNGVAVGMLMLSAVLLAMFQTSEKLWHKGMFGFMMLGTMFRALTTYSRGGLLAFGAMSTMYWLRSRHKLRTGIIVAVLGGGLLSMLPQQYWDRMRTIGTTEREEMDASQSGRLHFWSVAVRMANANPFFGIGHTGFQAAYNEYDDSNGLYGRSRAVHSSWFGVLAEQGYAGLLMFITILGGAFLAAGRGRKLAAKAPDGQRVFAYAGAIQTALVTAAVGGTFLSYHYVEIMWHFIGMAYAVERIAAGLATAPVVKPAAAPVVTMPPRPRAAAAAAQTRA